MTIKNSWNICEEDGTVKDIHNCTNNGLERYNRRYNDLFPDCQPSLLEWIEVVEEETRYYAQRLDDIRSGKEAEQTYKEVTIPLVPQYLEFKVANNAM